MKRAADVVNVVRRAINISCRIVGKPQNLAKVARKMQAKELQTKFSTGFQNQTFRKENIKQVMQDAGNAGGVQYRSELRGKS